MDKVIPYGQEQFNHEYYGGGARGGFTRYDWNDPEQQKQLELKWDVCRWNSDYNSILFVGCAKGFEVRYFQEHGKDAHGVDISQYAIENCEKSVNHLCHRFDGMNISIPDNSVDMVAAFDVLTLVPSEMLEKLTSEIVRVARHKILIRTIVKNWRNLDDQWDGEDGVTFRYWPFHAWDKVFTQSGKFRLQEAKMHEQYECVILWVKK